MNSVDKLGMHFVIDFNTFCFRIFQVGTRVFSDGQVGGFDTLGMTYPDFIYFMLSEEDKTTVGWNCSAHFFAKLS